MPRRPIVSALTGLALLSLGRPLLAQGETTPSRALDLEYRQSIERCVETCLAGECPGKAQDEACRARCREHCGWGEPARALGPLPPTQDSITGPAQRALPTELKPTEDLSGAALALVAGAMIAPSLFYVFDAPGTAAQYRRYHEWRFSLSGGGGMAFPDSALARGEGRLEWWALGAAVDGSGWERSGVDLHRLSLLFGYVTPPRRHSQIRLLGGPVWEWADGDAAVGGIFALPSTVLLPKNFNLELDPRIGGLRDRVIGEINLFAGLPLASFLRLRFGGQVLFRGSEVSGGPQALLEFGR